MTHTHIALLIFAAIAAGYPVHRYFDPRRQR